MARRRRTPNPEVQETPMVTEEVPVAEAEPVSPDSAESEADAVDLEVEEPVAEEGSSEQDEVEEEVPDFGEGLQGRLRQALYRRGRAVIEWLDLAHQELSPEAVHQLRVSSRRLETALELFAGLVGRAPVRKIRRQLKRHRRALGPLRDLQRQLEWLSDEPLLDEYLTEKAAQLPATVRRARKKVRRSSVSRLEKRLEHLDALLAGLLEEADQEEQVREIFSRHLWESLLSAMACADEVDPDHSFSYHPLRLTLKHFRYGAEVFREAGWPTPLDEQQGWEKIKGLHEALGSLQDVEVLACHLDLYWAESPPVRESQARVVNRLLKERHQQLGKVHLQDLDWESLWEWPQEESSVEEDGAEVE